MIENVLRHVFLFVDSAIYSSVGSIYNAALSLYDINSILDASEIIKRTMTVVYSFLGLVIFFKLAVSLIQMLIDPALIDDKQKGVGKLGLNLILTLVLIVAIPMAFNVSREIQTKVLEEKVIENAIYGDENTTDTDTVGDRLSLSVWSVFLHPQGDNAKEMKQNSVYDTWHEFFDVSPTRKKVFGWDTEKLKDILNEKNGTSSKYQLTYIYILSTIAALYLLWVMVQLALDVAYRSLKMLVLEIISPIAIMSYVDPKSSKDGIFAKWLKETLTTYISLFIRIAIFALASVLLLEFSSSVSIQGNIITKLIYTLVVVGLLKSGPKLIDKIFGSELSKDGETKVIKDMFKGVLGGAAAGAVGAVTGGIAGASVAPNSGKNWALKKTWSAAKGAVHGASSGASKGYEGTKKGNVMRGVVSNSLGAYNAVRKDYGLSQTEPWYKESNESAIKQMRKTVETCEPKKSARIAELENDNNKLLNEIIYGNGTDKESYSISKNGYKLDLKNVDASYIKDAGIRDAIKKTEASVAVNNSMGLNEVGTYNTEAYRNLDVTIAEGILAQAQADISSRINVDMDTKINYVKDKYNKLGYSQEKIDKMIASINVDEVYTTEIVESVNRKLSSDGSLDIQKLSNIVNKAKADAKDFETARERYEKESTNGINDKRKKELYKAAKGDIEREKANKNNE